MASRLELQEELKELLGTENVYFQPPESKKIIYDAIIYHRNNFHTRHANDDKYILMNRYEIECIYRNPDSELPKNILKHFKYCNFDRHFISDNLNHDTFDLYY